VIWHQFKRIFRPLKVAQHATQHGIVSEKNPSPSEQKRVLDALQVKPPALFPDVLTPKFLELPAQARHTG